MSEVELTRAELYEFVSKYEQRIAELERQLDAITIVCDAQLKIAREALERIKNWEGIGGEPEIATEALKKIDNANTPN